MNENSKDNYGKLLGATLIYSLFFTFCIYKNFAGITSPFLASATVAYALYSLRQYGIALKKGSYFYIISIILLGVSSCMTGSGPIIFFNTVGMGLLLLCMMLHNFFNDEHWTLAKYTGAIFMSFLGALEELPAPYNDIKEYSDKSEKNSKSIYIVIGLVISFPMLSVIIALLYSADAVFAEMIKNVFEDISFDTIIGILCTFAFSFFAAYCGVKFFGKRKISEAVKDHKNMEPLIAITVLGMISIVYLLFSVIQIVYLFIGNMELPAGYTYATYVHEGFFQLLVVCMLNVIIVLGTMAMFRKNKMVNILLTVISICTYIMLASSGLRMCMYIKNYSLTFLRVLVLWCLGVIAILLAGIVLQIFKENFCLFRYGMVAVCVCYLFLSFSHADYWIAHFNLNYIEQNEGMVDYDYISELSSDAAWEISKHDGDWVETYASRQSDYKNDGMRKFNFSHYYAARYLQNK